MLRLKRNKTKIKMKTFYYIVILISILASFSTIGNDENKLKDITPRVIVTSDGEIDDECSMVRFLLYTNEWDVEGIITFKFTISLAWTSAGRAMTGHDPYLEAYAEVYPNLIQA